jgi:gas vesicle protein
MRDHDDLPYIVIERRSAGFGPFLWGAIIGAAAGLLLAPRSGTETQDDIRERYRRARTAAEDRIDTARDTVARTRGRVEEQLDTMRRRFNDVREEIDERSGQARSAMEQGRRVAKDARQEIERRVHDARETYRGSSTSTPGSTNPPSERVPRPGIDVVVTDVAEERTEGRSDLG